LEVPFASNSRHVTSAAAIPCLVALKARNS
jgi:hypothetical protein